MQFDIKAGLRFVQRELAPFLGEFEPPMVPTGDPGEFHLQNTFYEAIDADTLYAMVRRFKPRRVLELGSGMSTLLIDQARRRNGLTSSDTTCTTRFPALTFARRWNESPAYIRSC